MNCKKYSISKKIFLNNNKKDLNLGIQCKCGMSRMGFSIAEDESNYYIINIQDIIVFSIEKTVEYKRFIQSGYMNNRKLYRILNGNYIVEYDGLKEINITGKDLYYMDDIYYDVLNAEAEIIESHVSHKEEFDYVPIEMGYNQIYYNKCFFDIESLKKLYTIPSKFEVDGIFEDGKCKLLGLGDYKDFVVSVKSESIFDSDLYENVYDVLNNHLTLTKNHNKMLLGKKYLYQYGYLYYSNSDPSPFVSYKETRRIKEYEYSYEDFAKLDCLSDDIVAILECIRFVIPFKDYIFSDISKFAIDKRFVFYIGCRTMIFLFKDFVMFVYQNKTCKFFNYHGELINSNIYYLDDFNTLQRIGEYSSFDNKLNCYRFADSELYRNRNYFYLFYDNDKINEVEMPDNKTLSFHKICDNYTIYTPKEDKSHNTDSSQNVFFDFYGQRLDLKYIECELKTTIKDNLYELRVPFENTNKPLLVKGQLLLPVPESFENAKTLIKTANNSRNKYITYIQHLFDVTDLQKPISVYKFVCHPYGFCSINGDIQYFYSYEKMLKKLKYRHKFNNKKFKKK